MVRMHKRLDINGHGDKARRCLHPNGPRPPWTGMLAAEPEAVEPIPVHTAVIVVRFMSEPFGTQSLMFQTGSVEPITDTVRDCNGKILDAKRWVRPCCRAQGVDSRTPSCFVAHPATTTVQNSYHGKRLMLSTWRINTLSGQTRSDFCGCIVPASPSAFPRICNGNLHDDRTHVM